MTYRRASAGLLALAALWALAACRDRSSSGSGFAVLSTGDLVDGARWATNRPIVIRFDRAIDFASVGPDTVKIYELGSGVPARGRYALLEGAEGRTLSFQPICPLDEELQETGFRRGACYRLEIPGGRSARSRVLRSAGGVALALGTSIDFTTERDPALVFFDARPFAGPALLQGYLGHELVFPDPRPGSPHEPFVIAQNTFAEPAEALVLHFDQPLHPRAENLGPENLRLYFRDAQGLAVDVPRHATLVESCGRFGATVMLSPIGVLPAGERLVLQLGADLEDLVGERANLVREPFALRVAPRFDSVVTDRLFEDFRTTARFDEEAEQEEPRAEWSTSERALRATSGFPAEALASTFDWVVRGTQILDTSSDLITDAVSGRVLAIENGVVHVRSLVIEAGAVLYAQGPLPLQIWCAERAENHGLMDLSGVSSLGAGRTCGAQRPNSGGPGRCSGGNGGIGSPETTRSSERGGHGMGAYMLEDSGGGGGDSGVGLSTLEMRAGGGGGGTWRRATCLVAPSPLRSDEGRCGRAGSVGSRNCAQESPTAGGLAGPALLGDASGANDFFGLRIDSSAGVVVHGEIARMQGGQGGGAGGDAIPSALCPNPRWNDRNFTASNCDMKGAGGGGGGGALRWSCLGPLVVSGTIRATGGNGAAGQGPFGSTNLVTGGSGGGAGGMLVLQSATLIDATGGTLDARGGIGGSGGGGQAYPNDSSGGHGGAGIIQLHVPDPDRNLIPREPQTFPSAVVLAPDFGSRSAAQTRWFDTGFARLGGGSVSTPPRYEFGGIATSGVDAGLVLRSARETVEHPAPLPDRFRVARTDLGRNTVRLAALPASVEDPAVLIGWKLLDARNQERRGFAIVGAQSTYGVLHLALDPSYGDPRTQLEFVGDEAELALAPRFFRLDVEGAEDRYPRDLGVYLELQGADASAGDPTRPDLATLVPTPSNPFAWTADAAQLRGKRFVRVRITFEQNALRPVALRSFQLPFRF